MVIMGDFSSDGPPSQHVGRLMFVATTREGPVEVYLGDNILGVVDNHGIRLGPSAEFIRTTPGFYGLSKIAMRRAIDRIGRTGDEAGNKYVVPGLAWFNYTVVH